MPSLIRPTGELRDAYRFPGFTPGRTIVGVSGDPRARVITLSRREKKRDAGPAGPGIGHGTTEPSAASAICRVAACASGSSSRCGSSAAGSCGGVKRERLDWLAANPHYTKRFARYVGKQCRSASIQEVATDLHLEWHAVKGMDKVYMQAQLARAGNPRPAVIGIDEISMRKGHVYRIVVSDLARGEPIWFGGVDRSEDSLVMFYDFLGVRHTKRIRLAVMDIWKAFRAATVTQAPQAAILYDKFHVLRHLNDAMDQVRKAEYKRLTNRPDRQYIKGQKYVLLSHRENPSPDKRRRLQTLLAANKRLNTAYLLKEQFGQLWNYRRESWARKFFEQRRASVRWQRLKPFEKFAELIERHWDGNAAYCRAENKVALGFVEGLNNKIRVIQRRCYGLRDEDYLHLKILTCTLPPLPQSQMG